MSKPQNSFINLKNIYQNSYFFSFLKRISFLTKDSFFFKKREFLKDKKYLFPKILESSRVFVWVVNPIQKLRSKFNLSVPKEIPLFLFFVIFLFTPLKSWLKKTYPLGGFYIFFVPTLLVLIAILLFIRKEKRFFDKTQSKERIASKFTLVDLSLIFLIFLTLVSNIRSYLVYGEIKNLVYESFIWLSYIAVFYLTRSVFKEKKYIKWFLWFNFALVFIFSSIGIGQYILGITTPHWIESFEIIKTRIYSTLNNPIILSGYINIFFFLALGTFFAEKILKRKITLLLLGIVMMITLVLTFSRSGWIGFSAGVFFFFLVYNAKYLLGLLTAGLISLIFVPIELFSRFIGAVSPQYLDISAVSGRIWTLNNIFHILPNHLLFGVGLGMYGGETAFKINPSPVYMEGIQGGAVPIANTDSQFLQVLIQQGILGFLAFVFFAIGIIFCGLVIYQKLKDKYLKMVSLGITSSLFVFFIQGIFTDVLQFPQLSLYAFTFLGILLVLPSVESQIKLAS